MTTTNNHTRAWPARRGLLLAGIILAALFIRLGVAWALGDLKRDLLGDEGSYVPLAKALAEGRGFISKDGTPHLNRTPAIPFMVSLVFRVAGYNLPAARVLMCAVGVLLVPLGYVLGCRLSDTRAGLLAAAAAAVFPHWVFFAGYILTDVPCAITVAASAWLLVEGWRRNSLIWLGAAGVTLGIGMLVRPTSLVFIPAVLLWLALVMPDWRRRLAAMAVALAGLACAAGPWAVRNSLVLGQPAGVSVSGGITLWIGNNPHATGILGYDYAYFQETGPRLFPPENFRNPSEADKAYQTAAIQFIKEHPGQFARLCAIRFYEFWKVYSPRVSLLPNLATVASFGVALPFFLLQLFRRGWRRGPELLFTLMIASQTAVHTVFTSITRYRMPIEPLVVVMAAAGAIWVVDRMWKRRLPAPAQRAPLGDKH